MRLSENKWGKSISSDSPCWVWISSRYPKWILREFRSNHGGIWWLRRPLENWISQQNSGFEKLVLVGEIADFDNTTSVVIIWNICNPTQFRQTTRYCGILSIKQSIKICLTQYKLMIYHLVDLSLLSLLSWISISDLNLNADPSLGA